VSEVLKAEGISSGYGKLTIINNVTLEVGKSEIVVILGPNGSGKSTLLKTLFGLLPLKSGRISYQGKDISGKKPYELVSLGIAYVPQVENIFPSLTVRENLEMGGFLLKNTEERIEEMYSLFPVLKEKAEHSAINLSGGERQMLALARALMLSPELLLLDEPTAGLAPAMINTVMEKISEIRKAGVSILLVEQNAKSALKIADRGYILASGTKVFEGTPKEILENEDIGKIYFGIKK